MFRLILVLVFTSLPLNASTTMLDEYRWQSRLLLLFAPSVQHPQLLNQQAMLLAETAGLIERDLQVWQLTEDGRMISSLPPLPETGPAQDSQAFYLRFNIPVGKFTVLLIGKDGGEKLRQDRPVTTERLFAVIDAMPMRQREMLEAQLKRE